MSDSGILKGARPSFRFSRRQSIALVVGCTLFGAGAQILIKWGANGLVSSSPWAMLSNPPLVAGYSLYAALVHESELARNEPDSQVHHLPRAYDDGLPSSAIRLRM